MNICTIFLHVKSTWINKAFRTKKSDTITSKMKKGCQSGQKKDVTISSKELHSQQGEVFKTVFLENELIYAKKIKDTKYFLFADDSSQEMDELDIQVVFITEANDLTNNITEIFKNIKSFLPLLQFHLSYRKKEVKIYKIVNGDIEERGLHVTASFENVKPLTKYDSFESHMVFTLLCIFTMLTIFFKNDPVFFGSFLSVTSTLILNFWSIVYKYYAVKNSVKITDFKKLFNNEALLCEEGYTPPACDGDEEK